MTDEKQPGADAEWAETQSALDAAYKLLDSAQQRERKGLDDRDKLMETISMQAKELAQLSGEKTVVRRVLEYTALLIILALAAELLYLGYQLNALLR